MTRSSPIPQTGSIVKTFLRRMDYSTPDIDSTNAELEQALVDLMDSWNIRCAQLEKTLHLAASSAELCYHDCPFEEKVTMARYGWFMFYVDDGASHDIDTFASFQQRFMRGLPQLDPVLDAFSDTLLHICDRYDTNTANSILTATFEFINSTCMEPEIETIPLVRGVVRFPLFLRDRTGVSASFALLQYPKIMNIKSVNYIQALPDMIFWISLSNDLLSFHKEELAQEKTNYVHNRSRVEGKTPIHVLTEMEHELATARDTIYAALAECPRAIEAWRGFELGYVASHLAQKRYRLRDLEL